MILDLRGQIGIDNAPMSSSLVSTAPRPQHRAVTSSSPAPLSRRIAMLLCPPSEPPAIFSSPPAHPLHLATPVSSHRSAPAGRGAGLTNDARDPSEAAEQDVDAEVGPASALQKHGDEREQDGEEVETDVRLERPVSAVALAGGGWCHVPKGRGAGHLEIRHTLCTLLACKIGVALRELVVRPPQPAQLRRPRPKAKGPSPSPGCLGHELWTCALGAHVCASPSIQLGSSEEQHTWRGWTPRRALLAEARPPYGPAPECAAPTQAAYSDSNASEDSHVSQIGCLKAGISTLLLACGSCHRRMHRVQDVVQSCPDDPEESETAFRHRVTRPGGYSDPVKMWWKIRRDEASREVDDRRLRGIRRPDYPNAKQGGGHFKLKGSSACACPGESPK
ncbi:unnamed protein product [Diplocarpon coronariae]